MTSNTIDHLLRLLSHAAEQEDQEQAAALYIEVYKDAKSGAEVAASPWTALQVQAKSGAEAVLRKLSLKTMRTNTGTAYWPADGVSISYDAEKLDVLCQDDPALKARLAPYRTEKPRQGAFTIR
jgi:hypothetical protein